jgi:hypothetical protein
MMELRCPASCDKCNVANSLFTVQRSVNLLRYVAESPIQSDADDEQYSLSGGTTPLTIDPVSGAQVIIKRTCLLEVAVGSHVCCRALKGSHQT